MPRTVVAPERVVATTTVEAITPATAVATMPDLLGLTADTVARVLADAGVTAEVSTAAEPAAGPEGIVVGQSPSPGEEVSGSISLTVSEPALAPDTIGMPIGDARRLVEGFGAVVQVVREVDPSVAAGTVLSVSPAVGEPVGPVVTMVVADAGDALTLSAIDFTDETGCATTQKAMLNGIAVQDSIYCRVQDGNAGAEWVLSRRVAALEATVGTSDTGEPGRATVRVFGDGALLAETRAVYGETTALKVDLRDVLRLRMEVSVIDGDPTIVLGDARLLGTSAQLAGLEDSQ